MHQKIIKKFSFNQEKLENHRWLSWLQPYLLHPYLWTLQRKSVAKAAFIGLFCACIPLPIQVFIALVWAIIWRAYVPFSVGLVWLSNPLTMPPLYYFCYKVGAWSLMLPKQTIVFHWSWSWFLQEIVHIWKPLLLGCLVCGFIAGLIGYISVLIAWRYTEEKPS